MNSQNEKPAAHSMLNELEFDIRGQICPSTLLTTLREVNRHRKNLRSGILRLVVHTDNRDATGTIPEAVRNMGYQVGVEKKDGHYIISIAGPVPPEGGRP